MNHITRAMFPLNTPVVVEAMIDRQSGWEFDAPLIFMSPFCRDCITGSICVEAVYSKLEDILIDLDCDYRIEQESHDELRQIFSRVRSGHDRKRWAYYRATVIVSRWAGPDDQECGDWSITFDGDNQQ